MKIISMFNNKGGVGKTTLAYHYANALAEIGKKVLMIDLDPQCNLTIYSMDQEKIHEVWEAEDRFVSEGFDVSRLNIGDYEFNLLLENPRTIHFLIKPTEEGTGEFSKLPPVINLSENLDLIPGRLTLHMFESKITERWSGAYLGDSLSIRTITKIRTLAKEYGIQNGYEYIIIDTSPNLGTLNKVIISMVDGFIVPCSPDMFSLYGIRNIGNSLTLWKKELDTIYQLISDEKRKFFPKEFVQFLGYTIYNAKKYSGNKNKNKYDLAQAHYSYALQIPEVIQEYITSDVRKTLTEETISEPIGTTSVMHAHNTYPSLAQKYHSPIWKIPDLHLSDPLDQKTVRAAKSRFYELRDKYINFAKDLDRRIEVLNEYE